MNNLMPLIVENDYAFLRKKGIEVKDFIDKFKKLSGIIFESNTIDNGVKQKSVWFNPYACQEIPVEIRNFIQSFSN